ncbi:MAG: ABC transporter permease [Anaerolineae bacterium]|jgi:ABC-type dipeptide/oligopeptide/nickel transport system permease component
MLPYIGRRLLGAIPVLWGVATLVFIILRLLPGDPAALMLSEAGASAQAIAELRAELGLDESIPIQYGRYIAQLAQGDLGTSLFTQRSVATTIAEQLPSTIELAFSAMLVAIVLGTALGILAAVRHGTWLDVYIMAISVAGISVPIFWSAILLIWLFALLLGWLPATGQGGIKHLVLPALVLGFASAGAITRLVRASLLEVMDQDFVNTARAKGLAEGTILLRHALKNAFIPVTSIIGLQFGFLLGGTVVIETIFSRPGIGRLMVNAILWKDLPLVQGIVLLIALVYTLVNLVTDVAYAYLDPRIHYG